MRMNERENLRRGFVIAYTSRVSGMVRHGEILHIGLGLVSRNTIWLRCLDEGHPGKVECILVEQVRGVISYAGR